jgi:hypothetical protein
VVKLVRGGPLEVKENRSVHFVKAVTKEGLCQWENLLARKMECYIPEFPEKCFLHILKHLDAPSLCSIMKV